MGLRAKTFIVMLLVGSGIAGLALAVQQQTVRTSFREYLIASRQMQAEQLAEELLQNYADTERWRGVLRQAWRWPEMNRPLHRQPPPPRDAAGRPGARRPPPQGLEAADDAPRLRAAPPPREPPPDAFRAAGPAGAQNRVGNNLRYFTLYDRDRVPLTEGHPGKARMQWLELTVQGERVGWLGWATPEADNHPLDSRFWAEQQANMIIISLSAFLLATIAAWVFSGLMLGRIRLLSQAVSGVARGNHAWQLADRSSDELGQLARDINAMSGALQQSREREQQWLADIAHELRTPLAVLRGELEALQDGVRETSPQAITSLQQEVSHLNHLIDDLHLLSSSESGQLSLHRELTDLAELLRSVAGSHQAELAQRDLRLRIDLPPTLAAWVDEHRIRQVIDNLLVNVQRYATPGPVELTALTRDDRVVIRVSDSGPGVPPAERERLFNRLYRTDSARDRAHGGSGLGLAICRGIVQTHGGEIRALASPISGLTIEITLPRHESSQESRP